MKPYRKGPGRGWVYRWREFDPDKGKVVQRTSQEFTSQREALLHIDKAKAKAATAHVPRHVGAGTLIDMTVPACLKKWDTHLETLGRSPRHRHEAVRCLTRLAAARGWQTINQVTATAVLDWLREATGDTVHGLAYIKALLKFSATVLRQVVDSDVLTLKPKRRPMAEMPPLLTDAELASILQVADDYDAAHLDHDAPRRPFGTLVRHLARYGCRPNELCNLTVGNYQPATRLLRIRQTKNGKPVHYPVDEDLAARLAELVKDRSPAEPLYPDPSGKEWKHNANGERALNLWYMHHLAGHLNPGRRGIYLLKDRAISDMDAAGIDDRTKALFTGHRHLQSFERYKTTNRDRQHAAIAQMRPLPVPQRLSPPPENGEQNGVSRTQGNKKGYRKGVESVA